MQIMTVSISWYLDDGVLASKKSSVLRALMFIQGMGPKLGLHVNIAKCELFCKSNATTIKDIKHATF